MEPQECTPRRYGRYPVIKPRYVYTFYEVRPGKPHRPFPFLRLKYPEVVRARGIVVARSFHFMGLGRFDKSGGLNDISQQFLQVDLDCENNVLQIFRRPQAGLPEGWERGKISKAYDQISLLELWENLTNIKNEHDRASELIKKFLA